MKLPAVLVALAWTLVHFAWQGALIAVALLVIRRQTRHAVSELRYALACSALLLMTLTPVAGFLLALQRIGANPAGGFPAVPAGLAPVVPGSAWIPWFESHCLAWLLAGWAAGVTWLTLRWVAGGLAVRGVSRAARPVEGELARRFETLRRRTVSSRPVRLLASARVAVPILAGCWRPVILIPASAVSGLPRDCIEAAILHELVHLRRHDAWVNQLQLVIDTLLFYHPAVRWVSRVVRTEREHCCDDAVVALTGDRLSYARALSRLESFRIESSVYTLASDGGPLMTRIRRILNASDPHTAGGGRRTALATAALTVLLVVSALSVTTRITLADGDASIAWLPEQVERWRPHFDRAADRHGIDADLLAIVTLVESGGNPEARSRSGATGLMQLMPGTAARIAEARGLPRPSHQQLEDPALNIDLGAWYLARQLSEFGEGHPSAAAVELAAAAYNGGPGQLRALLEEGASLSEETEGYRNLVRSLWSEREAERSPAFEAWLDGDRSIFLARPAARAR